MMVAIFIVAVLLLISSCGESVPEKNEKKVEKEGSLVYRGPKSISKGAHVYSIDGHQYVIANNNGYPVSIVHHEGCSALKCTE